MGKPIASGASNNIPYLVMLACAPHCEHCLYSVPVPSTAILNCETTSEQIDVNPTRAQHHFFFPTTHLNSRHLPRYICLYVSTSFRFILFVNTICVCHLCTTSADYCVYWLVFFLSFGSLTYCGFWLFHHIAVNAACVQHPWQLYKSPWTQPRTSSPHSLYVLTCFRCFWPFCFSGWITSHHTSMNADAIQHLTFKFSMFGSYVHQLHFVFIISDLLTPWLYFSEYLTHDVFLSQKFYLPLSYVGLYNGCVVGVAHHYLLYWLNMELWVCS